MTQLVINGAPDIRITFAPTSTSVRRTSSGQTTVILPTVGALNSQVIDYIDEAVANAVQYQDCGYF